MRGNQNDPEEMQKRLENTIQFHFMPDEEKKLSLFIVR